ncbi:hypothetical protein O9929_26370 [Vibrio lentus]|nr:hypothetical protein [Vibrio lentus]
MAWLKSRRQLGAMESRCMSLVFHSSGLSIYPRHLSIREWQPSTPTKMIDKAVGGGS